MKKKKKKIGVAGFFLPVINATVINRKYKYIEIQIIGQDLVKTRHCELVINLPITMEEENLGRQS